MGEDECAKNYKKRSWNVNLFNYLYLLNTGATLV